MTVWKSPVFYFGIVLVVAVAALLAAPFVVNWNGYRTDLEGYGRKLTGRKVEIMGDISVRLFPWPRLTADDVRIANVPGLDAPHFATAERIVVRMTLGGLARGGIDVESIEIEKPVIHLERLATGGGNWQFQPAEDLIKSDLLNRVSLDSITVHGGTVHFADRRRGEIHDLTGVSADVSAPGLAGPWRLRSSADFRGQSLDIGLSTGVWRPDEDFRVGVRVARHDGSGAVFGFDGTVGDGKAAGTLRIEPAGTRDGKADAEGQLRPLVFTSKVKADFDVVDLDGIEIGPQNPAEGGALTTGTARVTLGRHITATADMTASMLDLDQLAGARSRSLLREAGSLAFANQLLDRLPADMSVSGNLAVTAVKVGGETLDMASLKVAADHNRLEIGELTAGLPGRSKMLFRGKLLPSPAGPELSGTLALEANDLRQLSFWVSPELRDAVAPYWTGSRGRLKLQTDVDATLARFRLTNAHYEIDGDQGVGQFVLSSGGRPSIEVRLDSKRLDIDSFVPGGLSAVSPQGGAGLAGLFAMALPHEDAPDVRLTLQAEELLLNGVRAGDVALDLASGTTGLDLRTLEIGSVGGARLEAMGLVLDSANGPDGSVDLDIKADDPSELLRLAGIIHGDAAPAWARGLGQTDLRANLSVKPGEQGATVSVNVRGTVDELVISGSGSMDADQVVSGQLSIDSATSGRLVRLAGLQSVAIDEVPGRAEIKAAGRPADGYMATLSIQAYGARADYNGTIDPMAPGLGLDGKLSMRSTDVRALIGASGIPIVDVADVAAVLDGTVTYADGQYSVADLDGRLGGASIKGRLSVTPDGKISAHVDSGRLTLGDVLAATFIEWNGTGPSLDSGFRSSLPLGLSGEVWIKPAALAIHSHFEARNAEIGLTAQDGEIRLALFAKDADGRDAHVELASSGTGALRRIEGRVSLPVDLGHQLLLAGGQPVAEGQGLFDIKFEGEGRSPGGALAAIKGTGSYSFANFKLLGLSPADFTAAIQSAKDAADITRAFDRLRGGDGLAFGDIKGSVTIVNGQVSFLPVNLHTPDADVTIQTDAELALGEIGAVVTLAFKARPNLPVMTITYGGPPVALGRVEDNTELATMLGVTLMQKGVDELERLQAEQRRLALEEEKQRREDQARLEAYYAQRDELLLRRRELKVHAEMRLLAAEVQRQKMEAERAANTEINKDEVRKRLREIRVHRQIGKMAAALPEVSPPPVPKTKPETAAPPPRQTAKRKAPVQSTDAVILDQPIGAPIVFPPASPSQ